MRRTITIFIIACMMFPMQMVAMPLTDEKPDEKKGTTSIVSTILALNLKDKSSTFYFSFEGGNMNNKSHLLFSYGLGLSITNSKYSSSHVKMETRNTVLRLPILFGGLIGDKEKLHVTLRAGVSTNFLIRTKINDEIQKLSGSDRFGWNGVVRGTFGYKGLGLMVEYDIPFKSGVKGMWLFGFSAGI